MLYLKNNKFSQVLPNQSIKIYKKNSLGSWDTFCARQTYVVGDRFVEYSFRQKHEKIRYK